jgi:hypothetical protein
MKPVRVMLHGLMMMVANLAAVIGGFVAYRLMNLGGQLVSQIPVAVVLSVVLFTGWVLLVRLLPLKKLWTYDQDEHLLILVASFLWNPILFISLHYLSQGYLSGLGNVVALMIFQIPVNALTLVLVTKLTRPKPGVSPSVDGLGQP